MDPVVLLVLAVGALAVLMVVRVAAQARKRTGTAVRPVPVPPEEVELEEGPVYACMRCGGPRVRPASLSEGGIPGGGQGLAWICERCGNRGPALEFPDATAYRQFVKGLNEGVDGKEP